jgi:hypothetical protein
VTITTPETTIDTFLANVQGDHGELPWADDAVLDAVVPNWRLSVSGADRIARQFREWFADPGELEETRRHETATGAILEFTVTWIEGGVPHAARQVHVLDLDADGRVSHDAMWCGGRWPAHLLAEMEAARHAG